MPTLNEVYSTVSTKRRYEVWFLRMALADGSGAWWFRYLLMNPGRGGCANDPRGAPAQVWATWFPKHAKPRSFIEGYPLESLQMGRPGESPFRLRIGGNSIEENSCRGALDVEGHDISWDLHYVSTFATTLSNKGWIGFSRTPHSDAIFSGTITIDGQAFSGDSLACGVQGHNCGYRHRSFWIWTHAYLPRVDGPPSTLEALVYDMPLGFMFRKVVLRHEGRSYVFRAMHDQSVSQGPMRWKFRCSGNKAMRVAAEIRGLEVNTHRLRYVKTNCSGSFEVLNNSLASAVVLIETPDGGVLRLQTEHGAVLEIGGDYPLS